MEHDKNHQCVAVLPEETTYTQPAETNPELFGASTVSGSVLNSEIQSMPKHPNKHH